MQHNIIAYKIINVGLALYTIYAYNINLSINYELLKLYFHFVVIMPGRPHVKQLFIFQCRKL